MKKNKNEKKTNDYPSLFDAFELGDRVIRKYRDKYGNYKEYKGIVLAIREKSIEVYWDSLNGKYRPDDMNIAFTNCQINEIYKGYKGYTPIKKYSN